MKDRYTVLHRMLDALPPLPLPVKRYERYKNMRADYRISLCKEWFSTPLPVEGGVLFFTWYEPETLYGNLPAEMSKRGRDVRFMRRVLPGVDYEQTCIKKPHDTYFPEMFLKKEDIIPGKVTFPLQQNPLIYRMKEAGVVPSSIWYPAEGQVWEENLIAAIRFYMPDTTIIGYDNGCIFPGCDLFTQKYLPDILYTKGPALTNLLKEHWPSNIVQTGCELRKSLPAKPHIGEGLLLALSPIEEEAEDMLEWLDCIPNWKRVYVKPHPLLPITIPKKYRTPENIPTLLEKCNIVIYGYTSVCFEALKYQVWPVHGGMKGMDKMAHIKDLYKRLKNGEWMDVYYENRAPITPDIIEEMCYEDR